jgi:hypothetical protein
VQHVRNGFVPAGEVLAKRPDDDLGHVILSPLTAQKPGLGCGKSSPNEAPKIGLPRPGAAPSSPRNVSQLTAAILTGLVRFIEEISG